jgi:muconate cycloisomerase
LESCQLLFDEQPIPPGDAALLAEVRRATGVALMADESLFTLADAWNLATARAADIFSIYPGKHGGLAASVEIAHVAKAAGIVCSIGSNLELGVGTAAMLHLAAALPVIDSATYPADLIGPLYHEADMLVQPLQLGPEYATLPTGPGLGVVLDERQIEKWRE